MQPKNQLSNFHSLCRNASFSTDWSEKQMPDLLELLVVKVVERVVGVECRAPKAGALPSHTASVHPGGHGEEKPNPGAGGQNRTGYARLFRAALYQ
jgi:hypothetical protein